MFRMQLKSLTRYCGAAFLVILLSAALLLLVTGCDFLKPGLSTVLTADPSDLSRSTTTTGATQAPTTAIIPPAAATGATTTAAITVAPTTAATTVAPTTAATTVAPTTAATTVAPTSLPTSVTLKSTGVTEKRLGFVISASASGPETISIDYVEMYSGAEAIAKAKEDGSDVVEIDEEGHEYIPNDYYIRNNNPLIRTFGLAADCIIRMVPELGGPDATLVCSFAELYAAVGVRKRLTEVNIVNGLVKSITEFYLP